MFATGYLIFVSLICREEANNANEVKPGQEEGEAEEEEAKDEEYENCSIRPEEIPEIPSNKFLLRGAKQNGDESKKENQDNEPSRAFRYRREPMISRSGRKIKGRGSRVCCNFFCARKIFLIFYIDHLFFHSVIEHHHLDQEDREAKPLHIGDTLRLEQKS